MSAPRINAGVNPATRARNAAIGAAVVEELLVEAAVKVKPPPGTARYQRRLRGEILKARRELLVVTEAKIDGLVMAYKTSLLEAEAAIAAFETTAPLTASELHKYNRLKTLRGQLEKPIDKLMAEVKGSSTSFMADVFRREYYNAAHDLAAVGVYAHAPRLPKARIQAMLGLNVQGMPYGSRLKRLKTRTVDAVHAALTQGTVMGEGVREITERVRKAYNFSENQAKTLVRTAVMSASNTAALERYKEAGVTHYVRDETLDGRTCLSCAADDQKRYPIRVTVLPAHAN
jgi:SPP1 gp7 family putative phage head morphogenesis protein